MRDALEAEAREAQLTAASATRELKRVHASAAAKEQHAGAQTKELQGQLKAAEAAARCIWGLPISRAFSCGSMSGMVPYSTALERSLHKQCRCGCALRMLTGFEDAFGRGAGVQKLSLRRI